MLVRCTSHCCSSLRCPARSEYMQCPLSESRIEEPHAPTKRIAKSSTLPTPKRVTNTHAKRATKTTIGKNRPKIAGLQANEDLRKEVLQEEPQDVSTRCHGRDLGEWGMPKPKRCRASTRKTPPCQSSKASPAFHATCISQQSITHNHLELEEDLVRRARP